MLYNIRNRWFFLSQGNQWTKCLAHPKIRRPKPCLLMFASLVALDSFYLLLSTQLIADLTPKWSGGSMFYPLSYIYTKTSFCCVETVANNSLNRRLVVFYRLWADAAPTLNTAFSLTSEVFMQNGEYTAFWYLQLLCYLKQLKFTISQNEFVEFLVFSGTPAEFGWPERSASFESVRPRLKSAYHLLIIVSDWTESE